MNALKPASRAKQWLMIFIVIGVLSFPLYFSLCRTAFPVYATGVEMIDVSDNTPRLGNGWELDAGGGTFLITQAGYYTITGSNESSNQNSHIEVATGIMVNITLNDATIKSGYWSPLAIQPGATVNLYLAGSLNTLQATSSSLAGIYVPTGATLTIQDNTDSSTLSATGRGAGAGIGGDANERNCGTITINSGTIIATAGPSGAGIGGAGGNTSTDAGNGGNITINGGSVTANGGARGGAGIGGGAGGNTNENTADRATTGGAGGTIVITGGTVTANGGSNYSIPPYTIYQGGAGIGGGYGMVGGAGGQITISGGTVSAVGGDGDATYAGGAGIGGGGGQTVGGAGATLAISQASNDSETSITAEGGSGSDATKNGYDIGGGGGDPGSAFGDGGSLRVTGGVVKLVINGANAVNPYLQNCLIEGDGAQAIEGRYGNTPNVYYARLSNIAIGTEIAAPTIVGIDGKKWQVIGYNGSGVSSKSDTLTLLLARDYLGTSTYGGAYSDDYADSNLQNLISTYAISAMNIAETYYIKALNFNDTNFMDNGVPLWSLSVTEANTLHAGVRTMTQTDESGNTVDWWLRSESLPESDQNGKAAYVNANGSVESGGRVVTDNIAVRPAFLLKLAHVFMISAASGDKQDTVDSTLSPYAYPTGDIKFTMTAQTEIHAPNLPDFSTADKRSFTYSNATTGSNRYISGTLYSADGQLLYYGKLADLTLETAESGTFTINYPTLSPGNYTLKLFMEYISPDYTTDFVSLAQESYSFTIQAAPDPDNAPQEEVLPEFPAPDNAQQEEVLPEFPAPDNAPQEEILPESPETFDISYHVLLIVFPMILAGNLSIEILMTLRKKKQAP